MTRTPIVALYAVSGQPVGDSTDEATYSAAYDACLG